MTVWVFHQGKVVIKGSVRRESVARADFPTPQISRLEPYESPIDGKEISSWRQRDQELKANDAYDPRDLPRDHVYTKSKGRKVRANGGNKRN